MVFLSFHVKFEILSIERRLYSGAKVDILSFFNKERVYCWLPPIHINITFLEKKTS